MKQNQSLKILSAFIILIVIIVSGITVLAHNQISEVIYNLNLDRNREQAERIATLISINLESGKPSADVLQQVQTMLENTPQNAEHFACIIADKNRVIAHPKPSNVGKDVTGWTIENDTEKKTYTQSAGEGVSFGGVQTRLDGSQDITYQVPISTKPWSVCVHTNLDLVDEQTTTILKQLAWVVLPGLFLIILIGGFFTTNRVMPK